MVYFYTDWCRFCKEMDRTTFSNPQIAGYINQNFYCVRINAEGKDTIIFNDTAYYNPGGSEPSAHSIARKFLGQRLTYPSTLFISNQYQFRFVAPGMIDITRLEPMLVYILENVFLTEHYEAFESSFLHTYRPETPDPPKSLLEATSVQQWQKKRKTMISLYAEWCNSCRVMNHDIFLDSGVAALTSAYFNASAMHVMLKDTIFWYNEVFPPNPQGGVHSFITHFAGNQLLLPLILLFDEEGKLLTPLPRYQPAASLTKVLRYFGENHHLKMTWEEFLGQP